MLSSRTLSSCWLLVAVVALALASTMPAEVSAQYTCACSCCIGNGCTAVAVGSPSVTSCSACSSSVCLSTYPNQCPGANTGGSLSAACSSTGGGGSGGSTSGSGTVSYWTAGGCSGSPSQSVAFTAGQCVTLTGVSGSSKVLTCSKSNGYTTNDYASSDCSGSPAQTSSGPSGTCSGSDAPSVRVDCSGASVARATLAATALAVVMAVMASARAL